ncbi:MAG: RluA family pseudouridine synthase [Pseudomonadota bacterium]
MTDLYDDDTENEILALTPTEEHINMRLDKYVMQQDEICNMYDLSRARLQKLIAAGHLYSANGPLKASYKIKGNENITLEIPAATPALPQPVHIPLDILYEDDDIIVINKTAGMTVHPAPGHYDDTLVNALLYHCGESLSGIGGVLRPGIVHRLDKDTSGVMVSAKNDQAHHHLSEQFAVHSIKRSYLGMCFMTPKIKQGTIEGNIGRAPFHRKKMALVAHGGKKAVTHFEVLKQAIYKDFPFASLVKFTLETGRTHQIRVHASHHGFGLIGDPLYGSSLPAPLRKLPDDILIAIKNYDIQALHAHILGFIHPKTHEYIEFSAEPPTDFTALQKKLFSE